MFFSYSVCYTTVPGFSVDYADTVSVSVVNDFAYDIDNWI